MNRKAKGLLPIQNECKILLELIQGKGQIDLFPDEISRASFLKNRESISAYAKDSIRNTLKKYNSTDLAISKAYVDVFCEKITRDELDYTRIQTLYNDALNELFSHFNERNGCLLRWNAFLLEMTKNDALTAYILASCLAFGYKNHKSETQLKNISVALGFMHSMLLDTDFDEQISLASYDLAIEQASINKSLKHIAIASMIVAILAFVTSTVIALLSILG